MNVTNNSCVELTRQQYEYLALVRGVCGVGCLLASAAILLFMISRMHRSKYTRGLLEWIVIYLAVLTIVDDFLFFAIMFPALTDWSGFCRALGVGLELVNWVQLGCTLIIAAHQLYFLYQICITEYYGNYTNLEYDRATKTQKHAKIIKKIHYGALLMLWLPIVVNVVWLPFEGETEYREKDEQWCWIVTVTDDCEKEAVDFSKELILWYIPALVVTCVVGATTIVTLVMWVRTSCRTPPLDGNVIENYRPSHMITLITFALLTVTTIMEITVRTYTIIHRKHNYSLWLVFAVVTPFRDILIPAGYSLQVYLYRRQRRNTLIQ